ncbi:putative Ornithine decarboxylase [Paratrimastix pyriformis]|uniref:ornithine decarboxylase n=1 Tax=Paratrimastix pyriformis TaxID=342808 RepID=A0ABQ8UN30_9EUKA|nr:putative Ornithine decarboxylase [Paratrimastix pyriformis]
MQRPAEVFATLRKRGHELFQSGLTSAATLKNLLAQRPLRSSFAVCNLSTVVKRFQYWKEEMPIVHPHYAIKSNPDPLILRTLALLGAGFDCASPGEIADVLAADVDPARIIYANPVKSHTAIQFALDRNVTTFTFDCAVELEKLLSHPHPNMRLVLRIAPSATMNPWELGFKFGAPAADIQALIDICRDRKAPLVGLSFHVGSYCMTTAAFGTAVDLARHWTEYAAQQGIVFDLIDIGGGFPGVDTTDEVVNAPHSPQLTRHLPTVTETVAPAAQGAAAAAAPEDQSKRPSLRLIASALRPLLADWQKAMPHIRFISEPGRPVAPVVPIVPNPSLPDFDPLHPRDPPAMSPFEPMSDAKPATPVTDQTPMEPEDPRCHTVRYYIGDGVYGTIFGPTCDSLDCILRSTACPLAEEGDWFYSTFFGAYTAAGVTHFNGINPQVIYVIDPIHEPTTEK